MTSGRVLRELLYIEKVGQSEGYVQGRYTSAKTWTTSSSNVNNPPVKTNVMRRRLSLEFVIVEVLERVLAYTMTCGIR
ncbi:hypothetical protein RB195_008477 [Necator americanus]|uniref:Uncharacterized protein n=1 Tax=Necator americanus TaxID=51031 RepID=A0ABR1CNV2_NECAM